MSSGISFSKIKHPHLVSLTSMEKDIYMEGDSRSEKKSGAAIKNKILIAA
ncbi:hypothetical protein GOB86_03445 [Acetobacter lambici]|uniref:Uncharacterized protein n=1 Tax=Acetobacter lambici TaxID=1332824 RepID=A0ABT1EXU9_9PROT|nr:hypothetical protein [Acetobacter lambici]MCP1241513.1 hypothetical protein [Acetobacter lambici]MCP1257767.1 hypothetical protein [Acetobacter lambici]NHO56136.1 hypothetical protein [Acetobacter lambici]